MPLTQAWKSLNLLPNWTVQSKIFYPFSCTAITTLEFPKLSIMRWKTITHKGFNKNGKKNIALQAQKLFSNIWSLQCGCCTSSAAAMLSPWFWLQRGPSLKNLLGDSDERMWIVAYIIDKTKSSPAYASSSGINGSGLSGEMEYDTDIFLLGRPGSKPEDFGKCFYYSITVSFILWGDYQPQTKFFP